MSDLQYINEIWRELNKLRQRVSELEHNDAANVSLALTDGVTAPSAVVGLALIYVDTSGGDLKIVFGDDTVKTIVTDT